MQKEKLIPSHHDFNSIEFEGFRNVRTDLRICSYLLGYWTDDCR